MNTDPWRFGVPAIDDIISLQKDIEERDPATYFHNWFGPAKNNTYLFIQMQWPSVGETSVWIHTMNEMN